MEVNYSEALSIALQHPAVAADQENICRLIQVCRAWRTAVQQSDAGLTDISCTLWLCCDADDYVAAAQGLDVLLISLGKWVFKYAGTVRSINIDTPDVSADSPVSIDLAAHANATLAWALQTALRPASAFGCSHSTAACVAGSVPSRPLQLQGFSCSSFLVSASWLSNLPAARLTQLTLRSPDTTGPYIDCQRQLQATTDNPHSYRHLELYWLPEFIDLVHLTALQKLHIEVPEDLTALHLPQQLRTLELTYSEQADMTLSFTSQNLQLQQLSISCSTNTADDLLSLKQLQHLTRLELSYTYVEDVTAASPAWPQLAQQLVSLTLHEYPRVYGSISHMSRFVRELSLLTALTRLELSCELEDAAHALDADIGDVARVKSICQAIGQLTSLQWLMLELWPWLDLQNNDILHLSALTNLTYLHLHVWQISNQALDSANLIAVLQQLSRLQNLDLWHVEDTQALPTIGNLQHLTCLGLPNLPHTVCEQALRCLTGLKNLRVLGGFESCNRTTKERFWAELRS